MHCAVADIVKAPDFPQAKINKTLIALVSAKHVQKRSDNVRTPLFLLLLEADPE